MARVALLGAGWAGSVHAMALGAVRGGHLAQVLSRTEESSRRLVEAGGAPSILAGTYEGLDPRTDVVVVATPAEHHLEAVRAGLAVGAAVLVEKPLGVDVAEADAMIAAAEDAGLLCGYAENLLFAPSYLALARHREQMGDLHRLHLTVHSDPPGWGHFTAPLPGGGVLHDLGAHPVALALALAGSEPASVRAQIRGRRPDGLDDDVALTIRFASGLDATIDVSWRAQSPRWEVELASATSVGRWEVLPDDHLELDGDEATPAIEASDGLPDPRLVSLGYVAQLQGFVDAATGKGGSVCPLGFGREVARVTAAAYASAATDNETAV
jgi:predicted dehydrogenase